MHEKLGSDQTKDKTMVSGHTTGIRLLEQEWKQTLGRGHKSGTESTQKGDQDH